MISQFKIVSHLGVLLVLDIVLDGVVNLREDKLAGQELIVLPPLLHQVALHEALIINHYNSFSNR